MPKITHLHILSKTVANVCGVIENNTSMTNFIFVNRFKNQHQLISFDVRVRLYKLKQTAGRSVPNDSWVTEYSVGAMGSCGCWGQPVLELEHQISSSSAQCTQSEHIRIPTDCLSISASLCLRLSSLSCSWNKPTHPLAELFATHWICISIVE